MCRLVCTQHLIFFIFVHVGPHETLRLHQNLLTAATKYTQSLSVYFENPKSSVVLYLALSFLSCFVLLFISYLDRGCHKSHGRWIKGAIGTFIEVGTFIKGLKIEN